MALSKKRKELASKIDRNKFYDMSEAIKLIKECANAKFDETIDVALNLEVDVRQADQQVRGMISLPHGTGKDVRVAVFARDDAAEEAKKAGADIVGAEDLVEKIQKGFLDFDNVVATPDCMPLVGRLGKVLGPKGLMPNPKLGTVTPKPANIIKSLKAGMFEYRADRYGIVHAPVAKASFDEKKITENLVAFVEALRAAKPSGAKGGYMKRLAVSSSQGPGVKVSMTSVLS